jgi:hypothetical protein
MHWSEKKGNVNIIIHMTLKFATLVNNQILECFRKTVLITTTKLQDKK